MGIDAEPEWARWLYGLEDVKRVRRCFRRIAHSASFIHRTCFLILKLSLPCKWVEGTNHPGHTLEERCQNRHDDDGVAQSKTAA